MRKNCFLLVNVLVVLSAFVITGCQTGDFAGSTYSRNQAKSPMTVAEATIISIDYAKIEGTDGVVGGIAGGVVGAAVGNTMGGGTGKTLMTVGGAVGGALAGAMIEGAVTTRDALQINVQYADGRVDSVVQERGVDTFYVGQRVSVMINRQDGSMRVRPK